MKRKILNIPLALLLLFSGKALHAQERELSLAEALAMAAKGNKELQIQTLEEIRYKEITRETKSRLLPGISATAGYSRYFDRQVIFLPGTFAGTTNPVQDVAVGGKNAFNGFLSLNQPVFMENARRQKQAAELNEKIQKEKTTDLESRLAFQISASYFDLLLMNSQLSLQQQSLSRNNRALVDTRALFAQGRSLKVDTLRSYIAVENLRSSISYLRNNIEVSGIQLKRLIGLNEAVEIKPTDSLNVEQDQAEFYTLDQALKTAELNRHDIRLQKLSIEQQEKQLSVSKAERLPQASIIGQYQLQSQADNLSLGSYTVPRTSFLGFQVTVPIFNGNRTNAQINQARIKVRQENIRLNDVKEEMNAELAAIISRWKEANAQLHIQKTTVDAAELNYTMMNDRYQNGLSSRLELTDAELALTQGKINYLQSVYHLKVLYVELQRSLGLLKL
ncbi:TolC family protein [Pedobacter sp. PLR]|uniref:TolC family protein n=1 Tax=Pedobacter sp. PLR TaxID=2994465 RepID=UPI00224737E2|nr:TolC family protein [Pedobacter sp. PLR]MCX2452012.1 TolC family protein [Pedobacter sp. PLR]